ncbi:MAG: Ig-like domain-containing protein, partial [Myxococcota bacterium]
FDEPMDTARVEAAFSSPDIGSVTFSWNEAGDQFTATPTQPLDYAAGDAPSPSSLSLIEAREYSFTIGTGAEDIAGNALDREETYSFTTLRQVRLTLGQDLSRSGSASSTDQRFAGFRVGDGDANQEWRAGAAFRLAAIAPAPVDVLSASVEIGDCCFAYVGAPFGGGGNGTIELYAASFIDTDWAGLSGNATRIGTIMSMRSQSLPTLDASAFVQADFNAGSDFTVFRFQFSNGAVSNGVADNVIAGQPRLRIEVLVP